jgi:hypothetical protein
MLAKAPYNHRGKLVMISEAGGFRFNPLLQEGDFMNLNTHKNQIDRKSF